MLGTGADTHTGAAIKTLSYSGAELKLYIPKGKDTGWIESIEIKGNDIATSKGIRVGDDTGKLKQVYPGAAIFPDGRKDRVTYSHYITSGENFIRFYHKKGTIQRIHIYHELP